MPFNRLQPIPTAGKPSKPRGNQERLSVAGHKQPFVFLTCLLSLIALLATIALTATSAQAAPQTICQFGSEAGQCSHPDGVAVDPSTHDVYVADNENKRVDVFEADGKFVRAFGFGVADGEEKLETCTSECREGHAGGGGQVVGAPGEIQPVAIAVDAAGDVYVADENNYRVEKFDSEGHFLLMFGGGVEKGPLHPGNVCTAKDLSEGDTCGAGTEGSGAGDFSVSSDDNLPLAVAASGDVWVGDSERVEEFEPDGVFVKQVGLLSGNGAVEALAVDPVSGDFYLKSSGVAGVQKIEETTGMAPIGFSPLDATEEAAADETGNPRALTVDPAGDVFVSDQAQVEASLTATILEFDPAGEEVLAFATGEVVRHPEGNALAIGEQAGAPALYTASAAANEFSAVQSFAPLPRARYPLAVAETTSASEVHKTWAAFNAQVNPEHHATTFHFEYVDDQHFKAEGGFASAHTVSTAESSSVGETFQPQPASALLAPGALAPGTLYHFRVVMSSECEAGQTCVSDGEAQTFSTLPKARIDATYATEVTSDSAVLDAQIDPLGDATTYRFEYLTQQAFEESGFAHATSVPVPEGPLGAGQADVLASQPAQHLTPATVYRYRILTENALGTETGPEETFTTENAGETVLPDGRRWELVSPPAKHGSLILPVGSELTPPNGGLIQSAPDGRAFTFVASAPTESSPVSYANEQQVFAARGPDGWSSHDIPVPHQSPVGPGTGDGYDYRFFSEDLSQAVVQPIGAFLPCQSAEGALQPCLSEEASEQTAFLRTNYLNGNPSEACQPPLMHCYRPLVTGKEPYANVPPGTVFGESNNPAGPPEETCPPQAFCGPEFVAATPDLSHVVLFSKVALTSTPTPNSGLYEWSAGQLSLISLLPTSEGAGPSTDGAALGDGSGSQNARNAVSLDGSRVVWHTGSESGALYVRDVPRGETVRLDVLQPGGTGRGEEAEAVFQDASTDDSRVFFTDTQHLTATSGGKEVPSFADLYECLLVSRPAGELACELSDLTPRNASRENAAVQGVLGVSEDGSYVYFVANGVLENDGVPVAGAQSGAPNLYVRHDGVTRLVAVLSGEDEPDWKLPALEEVTSRVSPDGEWVAFMSERSLTGYDNRDAVSGKPDEEVYLYDAAGDGGAGRLICASCDPTGARPVGVVLDHGEPGPLVDPGGVWSNRWLAANVPGWTPYRLSDARYQSRYLSDNGRLFFNAHDELVPQAVNGNWDVYQWEPAGVGGCTTSIATYNPTTGGCVGLISSGESSEESAFLDASAEGGKDAEGHEGGGDVFFLTTAQLSKADFDDAYDVYDAHECSSAAPCFPQGASAPPPCTTADGCRAAPTPQPEVFGAPASATFSGPGNLTPEPTKPATASTPPCSSSAGAPSAKCTKKQNLKKALATCKRKYPHNKKRRGACETSARHKYGAEAAVKKTIKRHR